MSLIEGEEERRTECPQEERVQGFEPHPGLRKDFQSINFNFNKDNFNFIFIF